MSRMPEHLVLLVVQADEAAHAPVRAALKGIEGTEYEIHWVTTPRAALAALEEHPHDAFLVDRELDEPGHNGLDVARRHPRPQPARAGDPARRPRRPRHRPRGDRDRRRGLPRAPEPARRSSAPALRDHPPARAAAAGRVRGAPRARAPGRQRRPVGLGRARRQAVLLAALEGDARLPRGRDRRRARASGSAACTPTTAPGSRRRSTPTSPARPSTSSPSTGSSTATAATAGCSRAGSRCATPTAAPRASSAPRPTSPTAARPSSASSTTRCTTRSPACRTACCSSTASTSRSGARSAGSPASLRGGAVPRPRPLQARQRHARPPRRRPAAASPSRDGWRRRCGPATPSPGSAATSSRSCSTTSATPARRP